MLSIVGLYLLLLAPQLNPALTPQKAPQPALPKIDQNACPFEGCQFGTWTAREQVQLFSTWKSGGKQVATIANYADESSTVNSDNVASARKLLLAADATSDDRNESCEIESENDAVPERADDCGRSAGDSRHKLGA